MADSITLTRAQAEALLRAVKPRCHRCTAGFGEGGRPATRHGHIPTGPVPFCDGHTFRDWWRNSIRGFRDGMGNGVSPLDIEATYVDLPHADAVRYLEGVLGLGGWTRTEGRAPR